MKIDIGDEERQIVAGIAKYYSLEDLVDKTVIVLVKRKYSHSFYGKVITSSKKYHAHDENNKFKIGDIVQIIESKPISKKKKWEVINK